MSHIKLLLVVIISIVLSVNIFTANAQTVFVTKQDRTNISNLLVSVNTITNTKISINGTTNRLNQDISFILTPEQIGAMSSTNKITKWWDSANPNIFWENRGGTSLISYLVGAGTTNSIGVYNLVTGNVWQAVSGIQNTINGYGNMVYQNSNSLNVGRIYATNITINGNSVITIADILGYSATNKVTRWWDSANTNIFWVANGGTNLTAYFISGTTNVYASYNLVTGDVWRAVNLINTNLQAQINFLYDEVFYINPTVSWVSSLAGSYEVGSTQSSVNLSFTVNKEMTSRTYSGAYGASLGSGSGNTLVLTTNIGSDVTYTITVIDSRTNSASVSQFLDFKNRKYYGASANYPLSNPQILALTTTWEARGNTSSGIALSDQYIYVAYPSRLGLCTIFSLGGFATSAWPYETRSVTNGSGYAESFYIYRSVNKLTSASMSYVLQ